MSLSAAEIAEVLRELAAVLPGAPVRRVFQLDPHTVLLRTPGPALCLSCHPRAARVHLVTGSPPRVPVGDFARLLRRELEGARIQAVAQPEGDRVVCVTLTRGGRTLELVAELTGPHGNLLLVSGGQILGAIQPGRRRARPLGPGATYRPPPPRDPPGPEPEGRGRDRGFASHPAGPSAAVEAWYGEALASLHRAARRRRLTAPLEGRLRARRRLAKALAADLARHEEALGRQRWGDLLLAQPHAVPRGATEVRLPDLFTEAPEAALVTIPLDPRLSATENAQRCYAAARRGRRGAGQAADRLAAVEREIATLEQDLARLEAAEDATLLRLEAALDRATAPSPAAGPGAGGPRGRSPRGRGSRRGKEAPRSPWRAFVAARGEAILVGRSARDNATLTFTVARGRDVFLHARDVPGSHVILRLDGGGEPDGESLRDAALLAKRHSDARTEPVADVTWTFVKHVRRGQAPGQVYLAAERTLRVAEDPERLARILARQDATHAVQRALEPPEGPAGDPPRSPGDDDGRRE